MSDLIGKSFGQYEITATLGKGGMATVYRATQTSMHRDVAIKIMSPELSGSEEFISRFEREAQFFAALQHPHILPVIDFGESGENIFIVMRLVEGGSLDERLRKGPLSLAQTVRMVGQIGSALTFAHNKGVVHRDLKPNNVLLDEYDNCYLTDFGLAKMAQGTTRLTRTDAIMGTPTYMAPEQWTGQDVDARTDIYALGVMTYEMITGRLPFEGDTSYVLMYKHMNEAPIAPSQHRENLPYAVEDVLLRALAKEPGDRFQSAEAMANALRDAVEGRIAASRIGIVPDPHATAETAIRDTALIDHSAEATEVRQGGMMPDTETIIGTTPLPKPLDGKTLIEPLVTNVAAGTAPTGAVSEPRIQTKKPFTFPVLAAILVVIAVVIVGAVAAFAVLTNQGGGDTDINTNVTGLDLNALPGRIAYNRSTTESQDIYAMNANSGGLRFIATGGKPSWSPDGQFLAFDSAFTGNPELFLTSADGSEVRNLTNSPNSQEYFASFSPDGTKIVYHSNVNDTEGTGNFDIFVMNVDGSNPVALTDNVATDQWPAWSPDGSQIAFTSQRDGNFEIYVMDADGENVRRITENPAADLWVSWSPDGSQIAFQSNRDGNLEIYVMNADGTDVRRLTENDADDQWPDWSPNGTIVFASNRDGNQEIYLIQPDGTGLTRVTNTSTDERFPVWTKHDVE
ncbi:MAG: protein kinase [bacterium]|nr:protein kinase [bacterium]